jgi:hypothetical protein
MSRDVRDEQTEAFKLAVEQCDPLATVVLGLILFGLSYQRWASGKRVYGFLLWRDLDLGDMPLCAWFVTADGYRLDIWTTARSRRRPPRQSTQRRRSSAPIRRRRHNSTNAH